MSWFDALLPSGTHSLIESLAWSQVGYFVLFLLVASRLSGLMVVGSLFGQVLIPWHVRILIVLSLALIITPGIPASIERQLQQSDLDGDGFVERSDLGDAWQARFDRRSASLNRPLSHRLDIDDLGGIPAVPDSMLQLMTLVLREFTLGAMLGFGVQLLLMAVQLAGDLIDQQTGLGVGRAADPTLGITGAAGTRFLYLFALTALLAADGHLQMLDALLESYRAVPPGDSYLPVGSLRQLILLPQQSVILALQIAAPMLAMMSLVAMTMGALGQTVPQLNVMILGFPVRALVNLVVLALMLSGVQQNVLKQLPSFLDRVVAGMAG